MSAPQVSLRPARPDDLDFARRVYYETMRWIIELLFGWDEGREDAKFASQFFPDQIRIITIDGQDVGWLQAEDTTETVVLKQLYVASSFQRRGIGTRVLTDLIERARLVGKPMTLSVVKLNPARRLYERHGFRTTHEDKYKFYMRLDGQD